MINYTIDGVNLSTYNVKVSAARGVFDLPKMKKPLTVSWPDRHGEQVDLSSVRFEPREITLECFMVASSKADFLTKVNQLITQRLMTSGIHQLVIEYSANTPLVFQVYFPHGLDIKKGTRWNHEKQSGTFQLKLREPEPIKKVLKFVASVGSMQAQIAFSTPKQVTTYWGDGSHQVTNTTTPSLTKNYATAGTYYIVLAGVIEEVTDFVTNAIVIWDIT